MAVARLVQWSPLSQNVAKFDSPYSPVHTSKCHWARHWTQSCSKWMDWALYVSHIHWCVSECDQQCEALSSQVMEKCSISTIYLLTLYHRNLRCQMRPVCQNRPTRGSNLAPQTTKQMLRVIKKTQIFLKLVKTETRAEIPVMLPWQIAALLPTN